MVDFSQTRTAVLTPGTQPRRRPAARPELGAARLAPDGAVRWTRPAKPDPSAGPVERYLSELSAGDEPLGRDPAGDHRFGSAGVTTHRVGDGQGTVQVRAFPAEDGGELRVILDVTHLQRAVEGAIEQRVIADLARRLGHEVNNPLAAIFGAVEVLLLSDPSESVRRQLDVVMEQADRIAAVIDLLRAGDLPEPKPRV